MSSAPNLHLPDSPEWPSALYGVELNHDERLLWADRPRLAGWGKELLWLYPMCLPFGVGALAGGWYFYKRAVGAGAIWNPANILFLLAIAAFGAGLILFPLIWPLRLLRSSFALTNERLIIRQPALIIFWPRIRQLKVGQGHSVRVKCTWAWLPDQTGDIYFSARPLDIMERVPHTPEVVALIRHVLLHEPFPPPPVPQQEVEAHIDPVHGEAG